MNSRPKVFLADLIHDRRIYNYCVPLNIGCIAAKVDSIYGKNVDVRVFKFADPLIDALKERPDILALSNYDWNINLNKAVIAMARAIHPDVFVVMGGPNLRRGDKGARDFLTDRRDIDAYVVNEGEEAFANLVGHLLGTPGNLRETLIADQKELPQIAYLDGGDNLIFGKPCPSASASPIPHPSAWLTGWMDSFMDVTSFPLSPIVETTRGCPYKCTFCTAWGTAATGAKSIRQYPLDVVFEELRYIFRRAQNPFYLFLGDANMGILERDITVVEEVRRLADTYKNVVGVGLDSSKNMVKRNIEVYRILGKYCLPTFAQQTFNIDVSERIGRKNVSLETVKSLVAEVHKDGLQISTDLLTGLPTEDKARHVDSLKMAYDCGFDRLQVSDIRLLKGTEMEEDHQRSLYGLKTKVRIIPNSFGMYNGVKVIDYEHCVRETTSMSETDFLELRLFHAHIFVGLNLEIGRPLIDFAARHGLHAIDLLFSIARIPPKAEYPRLADYYSHYMEQARGEWFDGEEEANAHYFKDENFSRIMNDGFPKLNYDFASRLILDNGLRNEFFAWMADCVKSKLTGVPASVIDEVSTFSRERVMAFPFNSAPINLRLSEKARAEIAGYLEDGTDRNSGNGDVELKVDPHNYDLLTRNLDTFGATQNVALAVQLVIQYSNKAMLRRAIFVPTPAG